MERIRCPWCLGDADYIKYHDTEWGRPVKSSQKFFEFLILEGAQAGLSWLTILKRREGYRAAFDNMQADKIARYGERDVERLLEDSRIIRNKRKILSAIQNARAYLKIMEGPVSFSQWLRNWVDGEPIVNHFKTMKELPASTELSEKMSKELKRLGFSFVGPTIVYAFMQATGIVNDHLVDCYRHPENLPRR
ncbi:MAG: DNA-3-methyladenine glycosylase I [Spirochaetaceae bacterium]|jgi:DNA-3-methyladenine glycosylase I|nr:DNA-3-methyladenine glycosylase I [Spirochaetaceae bacterium]